MQIRWREGNRAGLPMFPVKSASDLSYVQLWLLHWLQVYDWAYSLPEKERPSKDVIEDDARFDGWYKNYAAQKKREGRTGEGKTAADHDNQFTF